MKAVQLATLILFSGFALFLLVAGIVKLRIDIVIEAYIYWVIGRLLYTHIGDIKNRINEIKGEENEDK